MQQPFFHFNSSCAPSCCCRCTARLPGPSRLIPLCIDQEFVKSLWKQKDSYCRLGSRLRHTPGPIASGSHTKAADISTSGRRPELLHRARMGGACLPVDSGNSGNDRVFPRRIPAEVSRYPTEALACYNGKHSACFRPGIPLSPQGALWGTS